MVNNYKLEELSQLDAGSWFDARFGGLNIPTLEQVLLRYQPGNHLFNIELKTETSRNQQLEKAVIRVIEKYNLEQRVIISSFDYDSLVNCQRINPAIRTGMLYFMEVEEPWQLALSLNCYSVHPLFSYLESAVTINNFKKHNLALYPWTVNSPDIMSSLINGGVQGIITDYPHVLNKLLNG